MGLVNIFTISKNGKRTFMCPHKAVNMITYASNTTSKYTKKLRILSSTYLLWNTWASEFKSKNASKLQ